MNLLHKIALTTTFSLLVPLSAFAAGPATVTLGAAGNYTILAKTGISTTGTTAVTGNMGVSPAAASYITGFALSLPAAGAFSTSALVTGNVYASDYANPTPANLTTAILDMQTAYIDAAGRASTVTELGAGNIGGLTLVPGVYTWSTGVTIPTDVTLTGSGNDVWIFQIAQNLNVSSGVHVVLAGGAQAANIFWQVAGQTTLGTTAVMNGNILDQTAIVLNTGAILNGRALAQTAVTLDSSTVTAPTSAFVAPAPAPASTPAPTSVPVTTTTVTQTTSSPGQGQMMTLGNGQIVYVSSTGAFTNAAGQPMTTSSVAAGVAAPTASSFGQQVRAIAINLGTGSKNNDVFTLQQFLISQNKGSAAFALSKVGATSYFGSLTRAALAEFQASVGISPAVGYFGPITRNYLNTH
jgi:hypothetical protein